MFLGVNALADLGFLIVVGLILVIAGVAVIVAAIIRASTRRQDEKDEDEGRMKAAGVIMIGPIPIIFGTDKKSVKTVLALALALSIVFLIILVVYYVLLR
jgi:uncharacterized protein (TIGR00304 family)